MDFYTDGSRIKNKNGDFVIGWGAVCKYGTLAYGNQDHGSNINAEMFAIRDLLKYLTNPNVRLLDNESTIQIITDSKTSIQIIQGYLRAPEAYDITESDNYAAAKIICERIKKLNDRGLEVNFKLIRGHGKDETMSDIDILGNAFADHVATQQSEIAASKTP